MEGIAAEGYRAAFLELEVLLDDVLDGELVNAVVDVIVAKHVERTFIIIGGANGSVAVECDVVARLLVHDDFQRGVGGGIDVEVQSDVGRNIHFLVFLLVGQG